MTATKPGGWKHWWERWWFLVGLLAAVVGAVLGGTSSAAPVLIQASQHVSSVWLTAIILGLMAFTLPTHRLGHALRNPGPVLWAAGMNLVLIPLVGGVTAWGFASRELALGLIIAVSVPSTLASASVWARRAGGNDAVSLVTTLLTNGLCFVVTPAWILLFWGAQTQLDPVDLILRMTVTVVVPMLVGQTLRCFPLLQHVADRRKTELGYLAQTGILLVVFKATLGSAGQLLAAVQTDVWPLVLVWLAAVAIHVGGLWLADRGARAIGFSRADRIAIAFSASQKTMPIGVALATDPLVNTLPVASLVVFPVLAYHVSQLTLDSWVIERYRAGASRQPTAAAAKPPAH